MQTFSTGLLCGGGALVAALFIGGVVVIIFGTKNRKKAEASNAWPSVGGMITRSWIEDNTDVDDEGEDDVREHRHLHEGDVGVAEDRQPAADLAEKEPAGDSGR